MLLQLWNFISRISRSQTSSSISSFLRLSYMQNSWTRPCSKCYLIQSLSSGYWAFYVRCQECRLERKFNSPVDSVSLDEVSHRSWDWLILRCAYLSPEAHQNLIRFLLQDSERESLLDFLAGLIHGWHEDLDFPPFKRALISEIPKAEWASILVSLTPATAGKIASWLASGKASSRT